MYPLKEEITAFFPDVSPITQRQEGRAMPSRKIVSKEERANSQDSAERAGVRTKKSVYLGKYLVMIHLLCCPCFSRQQLAWRLAQMGRCPPISSCTYNTNLKLDGRPWSHRHLCSLLLAKDRQRALPKSLQGLCCHSPDSRVYSPQSPPCRIPALLRTPEHSRQGKCAALSENNQETSLE